jgi:hypothetical protein
MNKILVLDKFKAMTKKEQKEFLDRLEMKIDYTEMAYNETGSEVMLDQMKKLLYYFNIGYAYLK